jgi:gamma-glutamyltranspeptidase/glutathione hydrolase
MGAMFTTRPTLRGANGAVAAGHYLGAAAGLEILLDGGNAVDAAAAASFAMAVVEPHLNGPAGEVPILIYSAKKRKVVAVSGQGVAPRAMTIDAVRALGVDRIPGEGLAPATVPAFVDAWLLAIRHFGKLPLRRILEPAIRVAEQGFAMYEGLRKTLTDLRDKILTEWPSTAEIYLPGGKTPDVVRNPDLARAYRGIAKRGRDYFSVGPIAEAIDRHSKAHGGFLTAADLARYRGRFEEPASRPYRDTVVHKCGPWSQGPVFLQQLAILEGFDLRAMGHNSADYLHTWIEGAKLAFADREAHYGDPEFAQVPLKRLLSKGYAEARRALIDPRHASELMRPGDRPEYRAESALDPRPTESLAALRGDTTHVDAIDRFGNMVAATPSGGWIRSSPVVRGLGFPLGTRGQMFMLDAAHPNALAPGKRPRTTLSPSLAFRRGRPWMAFGTPGGDQQDQWTLQFFLNVVEFGMDLQEAIDAPTVHTAHFPSSFWPREALPGRLAAEDRIDAAVLEELGRRGHEVVKSGPWAHGRVLAAAVEGGGGRGAGLRVAAAASPRFGTAYAQVY